MERRDIKHLVRKLGFTAESKQEIFYSKSYNQHKDYKIKLDFKNEKIEYGDKIEIGDETTSNFSMPENFVVLECVNRLLEKGYEPQHLTLERKFPLGRTGKSGKADISVFDRDTKSLVIIECKTYGQEYEKEKKRMVENGGQLFSYLQQDKNTCFLCLYASTLHDNKIEYINSIVQVKDREEHLRLLEEGDEDVKTYKEAKTEEELHEVWKENFNCYFAPYGIFEDEVQAYNPELIPLKRKDLKPFTDGEGRKLFNQFGEILRHNNISDRSNAFNRILSLILCKIVDERKKEDEITDFQIIEGKDTPEGIQERLQALYAIGMRDFLKETIINYSEKDIDNLVNNFPEQVAQIEIKRILRELKFYSNNEFAFKEVHNEKLFLENAKVLNEIISILQEKQFRYYYHYGNGFKNQKQYLGNFFELLLDAGYKQTEGQFFTPLPVTKFIVKSLPLQELVTKRLAENRTDFLPYVIDYACGSGHFITEAIEEVQNIIDKTEPNFNDAINDKIHEFKQNADWAEKFVYGIEKDYRLARTAKVACFMNGDGQANIFFGDGLDDYKNDPDKNLARSYDVVIANPPYAIHGFKPHALKLRDKFGLFDYLTDNSSEIEALFIERTSQLLHEGGMAGIVLPSSILSNSGIYTKAREIIFKSFEIKAIVELGSNAFMSTSTNTVILFMQKISARWQEDWHYVARDFVLYNQERKNDFADTETMFRNYVDFLELNFNNYKTFIARNANNEIIQTDWYKDYKNWFDKLTEVNNLKKKKTFKDKSQEEQTEELERLFYEKVLQIEYEKFYYYLLTKNQEFPIIKTGNDITTARKFLGYEFKGGRNAGIVLYNNNEGYHNTAMYDETDLENPEKANYLIYQSFLNNLQEPNEAMNDFVTNVDLVDCIDFKRVEFEKSISLAAKKQAKIKTKWNTLTIKSVLQKVTGVTTKIPKNEFKEQGSIPVISQETNELISGYTDSYEAISDLPLIVFGDHSVTFKYIDFPFVRGADGVQLLKVDTTKFIPKAFFYIIQHYDVENADKYERHFKYLQHMKIPLPPKEIQQQIVTEIEALETKEKENKERVKELKAEINIILSGFDKKKIGEICVLEKGKSQPFEEPTTEFNYIGLEHIISNEGKLVQNWKPTQGQELKSTKNAFIQGNVLYGKLRPYLNKVWLCEFDGICSTDILVFKSTHPIILKYSLLSDELVEKTSGLMKGNSLPRIKPKDLLDLTVFYPSEQELDKTQKQIEKIAEKISKLETENEEIPELKEAVLKKYLE